MVNKLRGRNELTAIFASGFSRSKFLTTVIACAIPISFLLFFSNAFIDPFLKKHKNYFLEDAAGKFRNLKGSGLKASTIGSGRIWYKSNNYFISFSTINRSNNSLSNADLFVVKDNKISEISKSSTFTSVGTLWNAKNSIFLKDLELKNAPPEISAVSNQTLPILDSWDDLAQVESDITTLTFFQLRSYISKLSKSGINTNEYSMLLFEKINTSLLCLMFALLSSLSSFSPNRRSASTGKSLAFVFVFSLTYWLFHSYFYELGKSSKLEPLIAAFLIPFATSIYIALVVNKNKKLT